MKRQGMNKMYQELMSKVNQTEVTASSAGGLVELTMNGNHELKSIKINPECIDPEDPETLQDLILDAHKNVASELKKQLSGFMPSF